MVVESRFRGAAAVLVLTPTGQRDEHDIPGPGTLANLLREIIPVHLRKADIENRDIGPEFVELRERCLAVIRGLHLVSRHTQQHREALDGVLIVVDDENTTLVSRLSFASHALIGYPRWVRRGDRQANL